MKTFGIVVVACVFAISGSAGAATLDQNIISLGYAPIRPPQTVIGPGAIVSVTKKKPLMVNLICPADTAYGMAPRIDESVGATIEWANKASASVELEGAYKDKINASLGTKAVKSVKMSLSNPKVRVMPWEEVAKAVDGGKLSKSCLSTVKMLRAAGGAVTIISEVLEADVAFTIEYAAEVKVDAKAQLTKDIATKLAGSASTTGDQTVNGKALYWGVRDEQKLVRIYAGETDLKGETLPTPPSATKIKEPSRGKAVDRIIPAENIELGMH